MSKKNLSKTVIEGGRTDRYKWDRDYSNRQERAATRDYCQIIKNDPELAEEISINDRNIVYKDFKDKLNPLYRWLESKVGQDWDNIYSEVKSKFDVRTTPGRHIVNDHLISSVEKPNKPYRAFYLKRDTEDGFSNYQNDFYLDNNILKYRPYKRRRYNIHFKYDTTNLISWLDNRVIGRVGNKLYWFVIADKRTWKIMYNKYPVSNSDSKFSFSILSYQTSSIIIDGESQLVHKPVWYSGKPNFRQSSLLSNEEVEYWDKVPVFFQDELFKFSPVNK